MNHKAKAIELLGKKAEPEVAKCSPYGSLAYLKSADGHNQMHSKAVEVVVGLLEKAKVSRKMLKMKQDDWLEVCKENDKLQSRIEELERQLNEATEFAMRKGRKLDKLTEKNLDRILEIFSYKEKNKDNPFQATLSQALIEYLKGEK